MQVPVVNLFSLSFEEATTKGTAAESFIRLQGVQLDENANRRDLNTSCEQSVVGINPRSEAATLPNHRRGSGWPAMSVATWQRVGDETIGPRTRKQLEILTRAGRKVLMCSWSAGITLHEDQHLS